MLNDTTQGMGCQELGNCVLSEMAPFLWHSGGSGYGLQRGCIRDFWQVATIPAAPTFGVHRRAVEPGERTAGCRHCLCGNWPGHVVMPGTCAGRKRVVWRERLVCTKPLDVRNDWDNLWW